MFGTKMRPTPEGLHVLLKCWVSRSTVVTVSNVRSRRPSESESGCEDKSKVKIMQRRGKWAMFF